LGRSRRLFDGAVVTPQGLNSEALRPSRLRPDHIEREHLYHDQGVIVARHVLLKRRLPGGKKRMLWERADSAGGWLTGVEGLKPGLYRIEDAIAALTRNGGT